MLYITFSNFLTRIKDDNFEILIFKKNYNRRALFINVILHSILTQLNIIFFILKINSKFVIT